MNPATDAPKDEKTRHRSPNYPGISLKTAVSKIGDWYKADGLVASPRDAALKNMGYEKFTGDAGRVLSALRSFGLVQEADGRIKMTQRGIDIIVRPEGDQKRTSALKEAALSPDIYKKLAKEYPNGLPSDTTLKSELIAAKGFNPKSVSEFIKDFKATLAFAGLSTFGVLESEQEEQEDESPGPEVKVGSLVQWTSQGVDQFPEPRRVIKLTDDGRFAFVEGTSTGLPMKELTVVETQEQETPLNVPKLPAAKLKMPPPPTMRSYSWALSGDFNAKMELFGDAQTEEDLDALADYVEITIKALKRSLKARAS
jgi:hypothetical protein